MPIDLDRTFTDYSREGGMSITERERHNAVRLGAKQFAQLIEAHIADSPKRADVIRAVREAQKKADAAIVAAFT